MTPTSLHRYWLPLLLASCGFESHIIPAGGAFDAGTEDARGAADGRGGSPSGELVTCDEDTSRLPKTLDCTGLYDDIGTKSVSSKVREYTPAAPLWSDGAVKRRWLYLPPGTTIDTSSPNDWVFPIGTRTWKEFKVDGKLIETRLFWKVREDYWRRGTYQWNDDETQAEFTLGGDIEIDRGTYHIPESTECDDCHDGQEDHVLGFNAVNLGLGGAGGVTLAQLVDEGLLSDPPDNVELSIGEDETGLDDDGVPLAAKALGILHTNCGVTCHNGTPNATANLTDQNLRLDALQLDGSAPNDGWNVLATTLGQRAQGKQWPDRPVRIIPGDPDNSLIVQLMGSRKANGARSQMPPIGTSMVDEDGLAIVREWISRMPPQKDDPEIVLE